MFLLCIRRMSKAESERTEAFRVSGNQSRASDGLQSVLSLKKLLISLCYFLKIQMLTLACFCHHVMVSKFLWAPS